LLGDSLDTETPLHLVDREIINELLAEQQLSGELSSEAGQLRLGQVLGARLLVRCEFAELTGQRLLRLRIVDAETTDSIPVETVELRPDLTSSNLVNKLTSLTWDSLRAKYPLRARLTAENGEPVINIGIAQGVREGMRFSVAMRPGTMAILPGRAAIVESAIDEFRARVRLDGLTRAELPPDGYYVIEQSATENQGPQ
jgi:hypothetical protein